MHCPAGSITVDFRAAITSPVPCVSLGSDSIYDDGKRISRISAYLRWPRPYQKSEIIRIEKHIILELHFQDPRPRCHDPKKRRHEKLTSNSLHGMAGSCLVWYSLCSNGDFAGRDTDIMFIVEPLPVPVQQE